MKMRLEKLLRSSLPDSGDEYYTCRFVDNSGDRQVVTLFSTSAKKYGGDLVVGRTYALKRGLARIQHDSSVGSGPMDLVLDKKGSVEVLTEGEVTAEVRHCNMAEHVRNERGLLEGWVVACDHAESETIRYEGKNLEKMFVYVAFPESSLQGTGGMFRLGGWGLDVLPKDIKEGSILKLEAVPVRKVNDGYEAVIRRLSDVRLSTNESCIAWWAGLESQEQLYNYSPSSWGAPAEPVSIPELREIVQRSVDGEERVFTVTAKFVDVVTKGGPLFYEACASVIGKTVAYIRLLIDMGSRLL